MAEFTCTNHGGRRVKVVCGECGDPLCEDCMNEIRDPLFDQYIETGIQPVGVVLLLLVGSPIFFYTIAPDLLSTLQDILIPFQILLGLNKLVVQSSMVLGLALVPTIYYRSQSGPSDMSILQREATERALCDGCVDERDKSTFYYGVTGIAAILGILGLYLFSQGTFGRFSPVSVVDLRYSALGGGIYILRDEIVYWISVYFE